MELNFYASVKPLILFLSSLGIAPYYFKNNKLYTSHFNYVYIALLMTIYLVLIHDVISVKKYVFAKTQLNSCKNFLRCGNAPQHYFKKKKIHATCTGHAKM